MIPIQLTIQGLYSYQEKQTIDFKNLTDSGLFGIFGSVGSGKSSILEAISFALYGETERLNLRDKRAYNMMNLKSNTSFIEFDFVNYENKTYRATREFKRNTKKFDEVKPVSTTFYESINNQWIPLDHTDIKKINGNLSYENFKRTIIIPQGQFKEFLELGAKERTDMMKEIFNLQKFDLYRNATSLNTKNRSELDQLEGQLKGFEMISEEEISTKKETLEEETKNHDALIIVFKQISEKYQQLKNLKGDFEMLTQKKEEFLGLKNQKASIDILENKTEVYDRIFRIFKPLLNEKQKNTLEFSKQQNDKNILVKKLEETEEKFNVLKKQTQELLPKYEALAQTKIEENDWSLILQIKALSEEILTLKIRTEKGSEKVEEVIALQNKSKEETAKYSKELEVLKSKKLDSTLLTEAGNWFTVQKNLEESSFNLNKKIAEIKIEILKIEDELLPYQIDVKTFREEFSDKIENLENKKGEFSGKKNQLEVQKQLSHYADALHDGESCPLCGALEHPNIVEFEDVNLELSEIEKQLKAFENEKNVLQKNLLDIEKILSRKEIVEKQLQNENKNSNEISEQLSQHLKLFVWKNFSANNADEFNEKRKQSFAIEKDIEKLEKTLVEEQKKQALEHENLDKYKKALEEFKLKEKEVETKIGSLQENLKIISWENSKEKTADEIEETYNLLCKSNAEIEKNYLQLLDQEKELIPILTEQKTNLANGDTRLNDLEKEMIAIEKTISQALINQKFTDIEEVNAIIAEEIDVVESRNSVQQFRINFQTLENTIQLLEDKLKDFSFDDQLFAESENEFKNKEAEVKSANDTLVKLQSEIDRLKNEFAKKENLLKELEKLSKRADNLRLMLNLFNGAGFVQYVSSIYLRQLCDHANVRFHKMTRNQLSLQLNENNDFEIIDYLNEGRSRSVKTLSGGQAFQVSLSLALALAESVQANAKADKNFFFIDEGFGTQDSESVNVVFETLTNLQKENRIVGIISHVEELKEKMPVSLNIRKCEERGSLVEIL